MLTKQITERLNIDVVLKCETPLIRAIASRNTQGGLDSIRIGDFYSVLSDK